MWRCTFDLDRGYFECDLPPAIPIAVDNQLLAAQIPKLLQKAYRPIQLERPSSKLSTMKGKRAKQYRKLMHQYQLTFSFREPYQVLIDAAMVQDAHRCKLDLALLLERTLQGKVKPSTTSDPIHEPRLTYTE
jgi:hypothetical protein